MASMEKIVRVFISSTFRDMQAERDYLVTVVFPELRERLEHLDLELYDVDLRWGVPEKEHGAIDAEKTNSWAYCKQWIERVEPFFVSLLGQRYGWKPPENEILDEKDRVIYKGLSITEMELHHAVFSGRLHRRSYFYLRQAIVPEDTPPEIYREFVEPAEQMNLLHLKEKISVSGRPVRYYDCRWTGESFIDLEAFGNMVLEDLWSGVLRDERYVSKDVWFKVLGHEPFDDPLYFNESKPILPELWNKILEIATPAPQNPLDVEKDQMAIFAASRLRWFQGRKNELEQLSSFIDSDLSPKSSPICVVRAVAGQGKSALLAKLADNLATSPHIVITHFVGATERSTNVRGLLERLNQEMDRNDIPASPVEEQKRDLESLRKRFAARLEHFDSQRHLVLIIDAVNQLSDGHDLLWVPLKLGPSVRIILSSIDDPSVKPESPEARIMSALISLQIQPFWINLIELDENNVRQIVKEYLVEYCKELDSVQIDMICQSEQARKPLFLLVMLNELRTLGGNDLNKFVPKWISGMKENYPNTTKLFDWVLERLEVFGSEAIKLWCTYLAIGRVGMSSRELSDLLARKMENNGARISLLIERGIRRYLLRRGSQLDFFHTQLRKAVQLRYLSEDLRPFHADIASYMETRWDQPVLHALHELPYHLQEMQNWERLTAFLINPHFIQEYCRHFGPFDLLTYSETCLQRLDSQDELIMKLSSVNETLSNFCDLLAKEPQTLLQQLYLSINNHWSDYPNMTQWADQILDLSSQQVAFSIIRGIHSPQSLLFRDLGIQDDFIQEIGTTPDFGCLFSATISGQLRCFDIVSGALIGEQNLSDTNVLTLINIDKNHIFLGLSDGNIVKWDGKTEVTQIYKVPGDFSVNSLALQPGTRYLYIGPGQWKSHAQSGKLFLLNQDTCQKVAEYNLDDRNVWFYSDGWNQKRLLNPKGVQINQMVSRPYSPEVAFAFHHGEVSLFDSNTGKWRCVLTSNKDSVYGIAFNNDGDHLFIAESMDNNNSGQLIDFNIVSWSVQSRMQFPHPLTALIANPRAQNLFVGDWSGMLYIVNQVDMSIQQSFPAELQGTVRSLCCDSTGQILAAAGRGIRVFITNGESPPSQEQKEWYWHASRGHGSGSLTDCVFTSLFGGGAQSMSIETMQAYNTAPLKYVQSARQASLVIAEKISGGIVIVSLPEFTKAIPVNIPGLQIVHGLALDNQGQYSSCMISHKKGVSIMVHKVDVEKSQVIPIKNWPISNRPGLFMPMVFSAESTYLAAVTSQRTFFPEPYDDQKIELHPVSVEIFNIADESRRSISIDSPIGSLALSSNGDHLFIGLGTQYEFSHNPEQVIFTEARNTNFQTSNAYSIRQYKVKTGLESKSYNGHTDSVNTLTLSPDEKYLCSASDDHTLRLWDIQSQECLGLIGFEGRPLWVGFTNKDKEIVVAYTGWRTDKRVILKILQFE